jgi:hypothetical protein
VSILRNYAYSRKYRNYFDHSSKDTLKDSLEDSLEDSLKDSLKDIIHNK